MKHTFSLIFSILVIWSSAQEYVVQCENGQAALFEIPSFEIDDILIGATDFKKLEILLENKGFKLETYTKNTDNDQYWYFATKEKNIYGRETRKNIIRIHFSEVYNNFDDYISRYVTIYINKEYRDLRNEMHSKVNKVFPNREIVKGKVKYDENGTKTEKETSTLRYTSDLLQQFLVEFTNFEEDLEISYTFYSY